MASHYILLKMYNVLLLVVNLEINQDGQQKPNRYSRVRRCYTICHGWGFVARAEFCPSRAYNENRLGLLAVTSQVSINVNMSGPFI